VPRIAILGATGKLGDKLVARALQQGYSVNALARDPRAIKRQNEKLTIIQGDAETGHGLEALVEHCQAVVCAIGALKPVVEKAVARLVPLLESMKRLERFVLISRLGTGESLRQAGQASGALQSYLPVLLLPVFRDINAAEALVRVSRLPYTILRSTRLTDDPPTGNVALVGPMEPPPHRITRTDLAHFVLDTLEKPDWIRKEMTVGSK
jgi:uncharacterized protein YbjT (DUF2867 family)